MSLLFFFFNDTATTEIYTLSLHDALPISKRPATGTRRGRSDRASARSERSDPMPGQGELLDPPARRRGSDRKTTRLNSSHANISYAVFCLKKKKQPPANLITSTLSPVTSR